MHYTPLDGLRFNLRTPRVAPWSHQMWNYAKGGDLQAIQKMFAQGKASPFDVNPKHRNVLRYTAHRGNYQISKFLIQQGADVNMPTHSGGVVSDRLWDAAFAGHYGDEGISIMASILNNTDYTESRAFSTLHKIVLGIVDRDLGSELEVSTATVNIGDIRGKTPLFYATLRDDLEAVELLLLAGADPNIADNTDTAPLNYVKGPSVCRALLDAGADPHACTGDTKRTALHHHCQTHDSVEVIDLLVSSGVDVDVREADHETPLLNAVFWHFTAAAERLIELGADVNATKISSCNNSLHIAVTYNHFEIIPLLLAKGVDYMAVNIRGGNIAHMAAISADRKTVETLIQSDLVGLDFSLRDISGKTAAEHLGKREIFGENEIGVQEAFENLARIYST